MLYIAATPAVSCIATLTIESHRSIRAVIDLAKKGSLRPAPRHIFPLSEIKDAVRATQDLDKYAAVTLSREPGDLVPVRQRPEPVRFRPDSSYILIGCLGGLGRVIT